MARAVVPLAERLWRRTVRMPNGCLEWQGSLVRGYGMIARGGYAGNVYTHRAAWELTHGPIPEGMFVCHTCDNPPCIDPDHLFLGTNADNMADMAAKGRSARQSGEANPFAKYTDAQIREMRALRAQGMLLREIAELFGSDLTYMSVVCLGQTRKVTS